MFGRRHCLRFLLLAQFDDRAFEKIQTFFGSFLSFVRSFHLATNAACMLGCWIG
jgi:hypothetical protein